MPVKLFGNFWFFWGTPIRDSQLVDGGKYELLWYGFAYRDVSIGIMIRQVKRPAW